MDSGIRLNDKKWRILTFYGATDHTHQQAKLSRKTNLPPLSPKGRCSQNEAKPPLFPAAHSWSNAWRSLDQKYPVAFKTKKRKDSREIPPVIGTAFLQAEKSAAMKHKTRP
jgi:hypothetical protein